MTSDQKEQPNPKGDKPDKTSPNEPATDRKVMRRQVSDPHPATEGGYGRNSKVPLTGL